MRLRTLPVSVAGVITGTGCAISLNYFRLLPALLCLLFAVLAQVPPTLPTSITTSRTDWTRKGVQVFVGE